MKHYLILFFLFIRFSHASGQTGKIDSIFSDWNFADKPGGVLAVVQGGEVIYKKAFGASDIQLKKPNAIDTPFELASIAKQFTATCIALLEEQGKISKEDDIKKYFPQFQYPEKISIQNLLDHTSGIREAYVLTMLSGKVNLKGRVPKRFQTKENLLKVLAKEKDLNFKTGDEMVYTNINYILLADIVEKVSGMKLRSFADSAIFKPLKMQNTFFNDYETNIEITGYYFNGKTFQKQTAQGGIVGDHNLISTLDDLILWTANFYDNKLGKKDPQFFSKLSASSKFNNGEPTGYGYGLFTSAYKGFTQVYHGGDNGIHTSFIWTAPDNRITIICLTNSSRYEAMERKVYQVADLFLTKDFSPKPSPSKPLTFINLSNEQLSAKAGSYHLIAKNNLGKLRKITFADGSLFISDHYSVKGLKLNAVTEHYFVAKNPSDEYIHVNFSSDSTAGYTFEEKFLDKAPLKFSKNKPVNVSVADYSGTYWNESTGAKIKVSADKTGIKARKGIIKISLTVFKADTFYAPENNALFVFERNQANKITGLKVNADDFRNFRLVKIK